MNLYVCDDSNFDMTLSWTMQSLPKSLLWNTYPSPAAVNVTADSSQLHPSLGIVLGPRKQIYPKLAPSRVPMTCWCRDTKALPLILIWNHSARPSQLQLTHIVSWVSVATAFGVRFSLCMVPPHCLKGCLQRELTQCSACSSPLRGPNLRYFYIEILWGNISEWWNSWISQILSIWLILNE